MYTLFLDDERNVSDVSWMQIPFVGETIVVRNFAQFVSIIETKGVPGHVSFDHDLADIVGNVENSGYTCAKWLVDYCIDNDKLFPSYTVHSMNPVGKKRITDYIEWAKERMNI
jgi:hypothetical protein